MRVLKFIVNGQNIECDPECDFSNIASGSRGYLYAQFQFSEEWRGCKILARFHCRGKEYPVPLLKPLCRIPDDALIGNRVGVSLVGQHKDYRIPTNKVYFMQGGMSRG